MRSLLAICGLFIIAAAACGYNPHPKNGALPCTSHCPDGYVCRSDNHCWSTTGDAGTSTDGNGGQTGTGDTTGAAGGTSGLDGSTLGFGDAASTGGTTSATAGTTGSSTSRDGSIDSGGIGDGGVPDAPGTRPDVPIGGTDVDAAIVGGVDGTISGGIDGSGSGGTGGSSGGGQTGTGDTGVGGAGGNEDGSAGTDGPSVMTDSVDTDATEVPPTSNNCGNGVVDPGERCDDKNTVNGDGCSDTCRMEPGYFCPTPGAACQKTVCGNGVVEGDEGCDDGNNFPWDGCSPTCEREPTCTNGECTSVCGDGTILAGGVEECDDGNQRDGDGCSKTCTKEPGWNCVVTPVATTNQLSLPVVYRDFISFPTAGATRHPNFEDNIRTGVSPGLVKSVLGSDGKPVYAGICDNASVSATACPSGRQLTTQADFDQWYRDTTVSVRGDSFITLTRNAGGQYVFDGGSPREPLLPFGRTDLTGVGWVAQGKELVSGPGDFGFTTEFHYWFQLQGGEYLEFSGDDDVWVFLKNALLIDLGGRHAQTNGTITLTDAEIATLGLTKGRIYEIAFFHAERHTDQSNFMLTLNGFSRSKSVCTPQ